MDRKNELYICKRDIEAKIFMLSKMIFLKYFVGLYNLYYMKRFLFL